jgi:hypothetical protein
MSPERRPYDASVDARAFVRIVVAAGTGAAAAVAPLVLLFVLAPGLNDTWPLLFGAAAVGGALLLGAIVAGFLAYTGTDQDGARPAARRMLLFSFWACILFFLYVTARALNDL